MEEYQEKYLVGFNEKFVKKFNGDFFQECWILSDYISWVNVSYASKILGRDLHGSLWIPNETFG